MKGLCLKFYVNEFETKTGKPTYEWLLETALKLKIPGGSALRSLAGYGKHGTLHEEHFFELASEVPIQVTFYVTEEEADKLLKILKEEKVKLYYAQFPAEFGTTST